MAMKRVGILTFHYINNHGALIQAYALKKAIDKMDGFRADIVNYIPDGFKYFPYEYGEDGKEKMEGKIFRFHEFLSTHCEVKYPSVCDISNLDYDIFCVGSDQVWNFKISASDTTYLLDTVPNDKRKISYASSIGQQIKMLDDSADIFKNYLADFYKVSVREDEHRIWLRDVCGIDSETVLDPTFLLDSDEYEEIISKKKLRDHPYMLLMWYPYDEQTEKAIEFANTVSRKYKLPIVHNLLNVSPYILACNDGYMFYEGVEEFLWYIKNASIIITDSYHTMLFSIHFKRPFYTFLVESMRSRFDSIGEKFGITDRYVTDYIDPGKISDSMDFGKIHKKIEPYRENSKRFLAEALE